MSPNLRLAIVLVLTAGLLALINVLVWRRTAAAFGLSRRARGTLAAVLAVPFAANVVFRVAGRHLPAGFGQPLAVGASAFELGVVIAAVGLGLGALAQAVGRRVERMRRSGRDGREGAPPPAPAADGASAVLHAGPPLPRRAFVERAVAGSALALGGGSAGYGALFGRHDYELATVPVPIPGLSKAADGFTIVQLSDIHLGMMVGEAEMRAAEEIARRAKGDLIVLTGDLVDHDPRYCEALGRLVRRLSEVAPVAAIPGNHDYYTGLDGVLAALRAAGATVLVNEATEVPRGGVVLVGLDDVWGEQLGRGPDLAAALAGVRPEAPRIVLAHNPKTFLENAGHVALQLSGHTHGGQVNLGLRPADVVLRHGYVAGLYEDRGSRLYVNRGFGTAGPAMRVGAPPEVTRIVLVSA